MVGVTTAMKMQKVARISVSIPEPLLKEFDELTCKKTYVSRSKAVADALRSYLAEYDWSKNKGDGIGLITILYDHTVRGATEKIMKVQHDFHHEISSNTHLHLNREKCLEILITRADGKKIEKLASRLQALKGISQVKLVTIGL